MSAPVFELESLTVRFDGRSGPVDAVRDLSLRVDAGEVLAVVGESGAGKTSAFLSVLGLQPAGRPSGRALLNGQDLITASESDLARLRGSEVSVIFQDALAALNPVMTIGSQIAEAIQVHRPRLPSEETWLRAVELLDLVGISAPTERADQYPHQLSGGMRQRVMIAIAIANEPGLVIADEPTTALDVTIQAQVLDVLQRIHDRTDSAVVFVTHDLGIVAGIADRVAVMYGGRLVEIGATEEIFYRSRHPYTRSLLACLPRLDAEGRERELYQIAGSLPANPAAVTGCVFHPRCPVAALPGPCATELPELTPDKPRQDVGRVSTSHVSACHYAGEIDNLLPSFASETGSRKTRSETGAPIIVATEITKHFPMKKAGLARGRALVRAVDGVSFEICEGSTLGLVGESGSGKSTVANLLTRLLKPDTGDVLIREKSVQEMSGRELRHLSKTVQFVFQDPFSSLNPQMTVGDILAEPLKLNGMWTRRSGPARISEALQLVGLDPMTAHRNPKSFSGGQRQRIGIARALITKPDVVVLDEPVSALDVSVRAGILNLLMELQNELGVSYLFVAHDLAVVRHISDRVAVMYLGKIVEEGDVDTLYTTPAHPYTVALLSSAPIPDPRVERARKRVTLLGEQPSPANPPSGCRFRTRCWKAQDVCAEIAPSLNELKDGRTVACHFPEPAEVRADGPGSNFERSA
ncbi:ABC transporter ATP-binding protein [Amycolatopsis acidicola]|uniref:ABC transporter ATP-binding protein n=1 Tax=Amycolatopsis acidicola TaxID=2596893 RepID=A0A5N0VIF0_9PSEU|nr:ABC transporter ATP-binding protein [Amycolatopsis acidicola]KAA9164940.1 ABC transporter ATP-binding protein [Amycolatopsis acidicola]